MLEDERYCVDISNQIISAQALLIVAIGHMVGLALPRYSELTCFIQKYLNRSIGDLK